MNRRTLMIALVALVAITYWPSLRGGFLFFLLCLHCYLRHDETRHAGWYALALLACAAALTSKPSTVTLPAILLLMIWWRRRQWRWHDVWPTVPFFAMAAGMSLLTIAE